MKEVVGGPLNSQQLQFINELGCLDCSPWTLHVNMFPQLLLMEVSNHEHSQLRDNWLGWKGLPCCTMSSWTGEQMIQENPTC